MDEGVTFMPNSAVPNDITKPDLVNTMVETVLPLFGLLDIQVNSAAEVNVAANKLHQRPRKRLDFDTIFEVFLEQSFALTS